jgi:inner membrane protein
MFTYPQMLVVAGLLFITAELLVGISAGMDLVAIGSVMIVGGAVGILTGNISLMLLTSIGLAVAYIIFGRRYLKSKMTVLTKKTNIDSLMGQTGIVIRAVTPDTAGLVRLQDEDWRAISDGVCFEKDRVKVKGIEGVSLVVEKIH